MKGSPALKSPTFFLRKKPIYLCPADFSIEPSENRISDFLIHTSVLFNNPYNTTTLSIFVITKLLISYYKDLAKGILNAILSFAQWQLIVIGTMFPKLSDEKIYYR